MESPTKEEKPLTIDKAAFLLLRVRRVFKKKIQVKKEKNFAQDVVFPKTADPAQVNPGGNGGGGGKSGGGKKVKRVPPLIRSRTVPAIIVPFSILQAQLVKSGGNVPTTGHPNQQQATQGKDPPSKSDYSTPGVDYVQFLTGSTGSPPSSASAHSPSVHHHRYSVHPGFAHASLASRESISGPSPGDSSWNPPHIPGASSSAHFLSTSDRSLFQPSPSSLSSGDGGSPFPLQTSTSPHSSSGGRAFGRFARLLNTPVEDRRKASTVSLQPYHTSSHHHPHHHHHHQHHHSRHHHDSLQSTLSTGTEPGSWSSSYYGTPRLSRRRRSLEAEDLVRPRSVSIDSLLKTHFLLPESTFKSFSKRLSAGSAHQAKIDSNKNNEALVTAVEQGNTTRVISILNTSDIDINSLSSDGLSLLDVAVIQKNGALAKILQAHGGTEGIHGKQSFGTLLDSMVHEAEKKSENLMARLLKCSTFGSLTSAQLKELEKEFHLSEKRYKKLQKMRTDYSQIRTPDPPAKVTVDVISSTAVRIRFQEADNPENSICTKYKIEWSQDEEFTPGTTTGWMEMLDLRKLETVLSDLETGHRYYFRVCAGNCKGYGHYENSTPASVIPSSWRDLDGKKQRYVGKALVFDSIFGEIQRTRPEYASEISSLPDFRYGDAWGRSSSSSGGDSQSQSQRRGLHGGSVQQVHSSQSHHHHQQSLQGCQSTHPAPLSGGQQQQQPQKKNQKIISIKQLFAAAPKFQKNFKRGVFLSCVIYSEDKLLVTNEEFLPTIEIDDSFPSSLHNDFHWLLKVASTWEDVKSFKADMEKSGSASTFHFRLKLLQAAAAMQNALGVTDLGRLYYKTIRDKGNSVVVITTINYMRSTKMISSLNVRWTPLTKMSSRKSTDDISDVLINSIQEQILYHQVSNIPVGRGLYLGYLKLASSVDLLKIVVGEKTPNMLPHAKIRDNPHVSNEEWTLIQKLTKSKSLDSLNNLEVSGISSQESSTRGAYGPTSTSCTGRDCDEKVGGGEGTGGLGGGGGGGEECSGNEEGAAGQNPSFPASEFSEAQELFRSQLIAALKRLFAFLEIDYETSLNHRLYNSEVIEVSNSVSMLVVFPSLENVCLVAGQSDKLLQRSDLIPLPVQVFEMIHLSTYQKEFINRYARISAVLEMDTILAQHNQREAFSTSEMATAKQRMSQLQDLQAKVDSAWKGSRWVIDVVTSSRDKSCGSASIRALAQLDLKTASSESVVSADAAAGGGGAGAAAAVSCPPKSDENQLGVHSKSEQELPFGPGLKFSRSENQLSNFGTCDPEGGAAHNSSEAQRAVVLSLQSHSSTHHLFGSGSSGSSSSILSSSGAGMRKVSVPLHSVTSRVAQEKMEFSANIYSTHSQSDSTISHSSASTVSQRSTEQACSTSLHNLYRQVSSSQILVPNLVVSDVDTMRMGDGGDEPAVLAAVGPPAGLSPLPSSPVKTGTKVGGGVGGGEPPPVPPRRTIPPPAIIPSPPPPPAMSAQASTTRVESNLDVRVFSELDYASASSPAPPKACPPTTTGFDSAASVSSHSSGSSLSVSESVEVSYHAGTTTTTTTAPATAVIIQVYAAYDCGLSEGTSVRLQITSQTTARQVVDLFVKQLNAEVRGRSLGGPIYERTTDFCLVSVIGARERCLRNDFKPLLLQNPWKSGRLYVRKKSEVTAAIDLHSRDSTNF